MGLVDLKIYSGGRALPMHLEILDVEVDRQINRIPEATLVLLDGSIPERRFAISNSPYFALGSEVKIDMGYLADGAHASTVFEGIVTRHLVSADQQGCQLRIECKDKTMSLASSRRSAVYRDAKDSEVWRRLITAAGLRAGKIKGTYVCHPELVQYNVTDWDFIVTRAEALGLVVSISNGKVNIIPLEIGIPRRTLNHGLDDCRDLELELDGSQQWSSLKVIGWDQATLKPTAPVSAKPAKLRIGNTSDQALAEAVHGAKAQLVHGAPASPKELQCWADARLHRQRWHLLRGSVFVDGSAALNPLDTVEIQGVGDRFNGKALVSGVNHRFNAEGWSTQLRLGVSAGCFARSPDLLEMPAAGLLPAAPGLQIATVQSTQVDPDGELRVQVQLASLVQSAQGLIWARLLSPDAGKGRGFVFRPEIGDEVVIGFLNEDPREALILGSLFGSKNKPPSPVQMPTKENDLRAIVSRSGTRILFNDKDSALSLETTASANGRGDYKNRISINEREKTILIEDQHSNRILLTKDGIELNSSKKLAISAKGDLTIKAEDMLQLEGSQISLKAQQVAISGQAKVSLKGTQLELTADGKLAMKAAAHASLGSDALLEIKGSLVKIN
jgi:Rhs element Vgr protein